MITITGTLLAHYRTKDSWAVIDFLVTEGSAELAPGTELRAAGGLLAHAAPHEKLRLHGELHHGSKWGRQFKVERYESLGIDCPREAHRWLERLDGVGPKLAKRIADHFHGDPLTVLQQSPDELAGADPLTEVEGVGVTLARTIRQSWSQLGLVVDQETIEYLDGLGCTRWESNNVIEFAFRRGSTPRELLEERPFDLTAAKGFGFKRVDRLALLAGCSREAPARIDAAALYQLRQEVVLSGDTYCGYGELVGGVEELLGVAPDLVMDTVRRLGAQGHVVVAQGERGKRIHPAALLRAERSIFKLLRNAAELVQRSPLTDVKADLIPGDVPPAAPGASTNPVVPAAPGHPAGGSPEADSYKVPGPGEVAAGVFSSSLSPAVSPSSPGEGALSNPEGAPVDLEESLAQALERTFAERRPESLAEVMGVAEKHSPLLDEDWA